MFDQTIGSRELSNKPAEIMGRITVKKGQANSFKQKRKARKKGRSKNRREKMLSLRSPHCVIWDQEKTYAGPTPETLARLRPDPLKVFKQKNILNDRQILAFEQIRRAVHIITDGTHMRISRLNDVHVESSYFKNESESDYEIRIKNRYSNWIDHMTERRLQAGPVLDIIIDEMSLSATDRKRGKRKGWAKAHLQASLDLYGIFLSPYNRHK